MLPHSTSSDPLSLCADWRLAENPIACCELLLTKLTLSQLTTLHTHMGGGGKKSVSAGAAPGGVNHVHACSLEEFQDAYHRTLNSIALSQYKATIDDRLAAIFHHYDVNNDGHLSFEELTVLRDMLHRQSDDLEHGGAGGHQATKNEVTIYNEIAVTIDWDYRSKAVLDEVPEWVDCTHLVYHAGVHKYSVCWKNDLILFELIGEDMNRARATAILRGHNSPVITCLFVPHLKRMFTCGTDRLVCSWMSQEGWSKGERGAAVGCAQISIVYDPTSQYLFTGGTDGAIYLYPTVPKFGQPVKRLEAHTDWVNDMLIIPELECLVTCSADSTIKFFSTASLELRATKSSPQHTSGLNKVQYSRKDRAIYTAISGREVLLWSPFLAKPTERLQGHEKPIVGFTCFERRPEVITVDVSGKICIWDMRSTNVVQVLGSPDSQSPIGTTHSFAFNPHERSIMCLGDHTASMFIPQKGSCSALLDSVVGQVIYDTVHKAIICSTGSRVVVFELTTGECRHSHAFGGVEISSLACAVQQQLVVGTEEGRVIVVHIGSWKQSVHTQFKDSIRLVVDLGKKSRLSVTGECPKALALTARGGIHVFPYGPLASTINEPLVSLNTDFVGVEDGSYSPKHGFMFMSRKQVLEVWDVVHQARKTVQALPNWITVVKCVDDIDAVFVGSSDGCLHCFHSISCVPSFLIKLGIAPVPSPRNEQPVHDDDGGQGTVASWWGATQREFVPSRIAFDRVSWALAVMSTDETKLFAIDNIIRRIAQYHLHASAVFNHTKLLHRRYTVDLAAVEMAPCVTFQCRSKYHAQLLLTVVTCRGCPKDLEMSLLNRLQRLVDVKLVERKKSMALRKSSVAFLESSVKASVNSAGSAATSGEASQPTADVEWVVSIPLDLFVPTAGERVDLEGGRAVYAVHHHMPAQRRACPTKHFPRLAMLETTAPVDKAGGNGALPGGDGPPIGKKKSMVGEGGMGHRRSTLAPQHLLEALKQSQAQTSKRPPPDKGNAAASSAIVEAVVELKWLAASMAMALQHLHAKGYVALCHPEMVRYVAPYYSMFLDGGLWQVGEDASGALDPHLVPPEGLHQVGMAADSWLLGLTLFKAMSGRDLREPIPPGGGGSDGGSSSLLAAFDDMTRMVAHTELHVHACYRDPLLLRLLKRLLAPQASRRITISDVLSLLEGFHNPPRHLVCVPLEAAEARHEVFVIEEQHASIKRSIRPVLDGGEYQCVTVCEVPSLLVLVEFNGLSAHVVLWSDEPKLVGVTPPNSSVVTMYNVGREEVTSVRQTNVSASDLSILDDPSIIRQGVYRVERYCPFFSETQAMDKRLGKVVESLPNPYYLEGWHRLKHLHLDQHHESQKQRDLARKKRWDDASATTKTTSFEKILLTAVADEPPPPPSGDVVAGDFTPSAQPLGVTSGTKASTAGTGTVEVSSKLDAFLLSKTLNPHWSTPLTLKKSGAARAQSAQVAESRRRHEVKKRKP